MVLTLNTKIRGFGDSLMLNALQAYCIFNGIDLIQVDDPPSAQSMFAFRGSAGALRELTEHLTELERDQVKQREWDNA